MNSENDIPSPLFIFVRTLEDSKRSVLCSKQSEGDRDGLTHVSFPIMGPIRRPGPSNRRTSVTGSLLSQALLFTNSLCHAHSQL